jgi:hypothetical protein
MEKVKILNTSRVPSTESPQDHSHCLILLDFEKCFAAYTRAIVIVVNCFASAVKCSPHVFAGLLLVPNGEDIGRALGDIYPSHGDAGNHTMASSNGSDYRNATLVPDANYPHPWGVLFTVLGTILLDFDADACQSPSRAYLLDVTLPRKRGVVLISLPNSLLVKLNSVA